MCKIWTQEVKISKSYDRNKFTLFSLKERLCYVLLCYVMWCDVMWCDDYYKQNRRRHASKTSFSVANLAEIMRAPYGGVFMEALMQTKPIKNPLKSWANVVFY